MFIRMKSVRWLCFVFFITLFFSSCGIYSFNSASIPPEIKTIKINYIQNRAQYINPQLSPKLSEAFVKKVIQQTRLQRIDDANADYVVDATITNYSISTAGVSQNQASINRLSIGVDITLTDNHKNKVSEYTTSRDFDFPASQSLQQAEVALEPEILKQLSDDIFNKLFSNW